MWSKYQYRKELGVRRTSFGFISWFSKRKTGKSAPGEKCNDLIVQNASFGRVSGGLWAGGHSRIFGS